MAEVIGKDVKISREVSCHGCGSRIQYYKNDTRNFEVSDYTGDKDTVAEITCPSCGSDIRVRVWY